MKTDGTKTPGRSGRGVMDVGTCDELDKAHRQMRSVFIAISLLGDAETTPPEVMSGLADVGVALAELALQRLRAVEIVPGQTEYTFGPATH